MSDLTTFQQVQDKIKEQVKVQFFNMLPDEAFQELIQKEIESFFEVTGSKFEAVRGNSYDTTRLIAEVSPFRLMVWGEVKRIAAERLKLVTESEDFKSACMSPGAESTLKNEALDRFDRLSVAMAGAFFQSVMSQAAFQIKSDVYNSVQESNLPLTVRY